MHDPLFIRGVCTQSLMPLTKVYGIRLRVLESAL